MKILSFFIFVIFLTSCQRKGHYVDEEIVLGYRGKARLNPYLAAERYFSQRHFTNVHSSRSLTDLDEETALASMPASFLSTQVMGERVLNWVEGGGSLILLLEGGESTYDDFSKRPLGLKHDDENAIGLELPGLDVILAAAGIRVGKGEFTLEKAGKDDPGERRWHEENVWIGGVDYRLELEGDRAFSKGDEKGQPVMSADLGLGRIYFLASARPLRSAYLDRADHLAFLAALIDQNPHGDVLFLYGEGFSFWSLLWRHVWRILVVAMVMLVFWLWLRLPRFGPRLSEPSDDGRQFDDLLVAGGRFLWKKKEISPFLQPLREEIRERFHLRAEWTNEAERTAFFEELATRSGLSLEEVTEAMSWENSQDSAALTRVVRGLKKLLNTR